MHAEVYIRKQLLLSTKINRTITKIYHHRKHFYLSLTNQMRFRISHELLLAPKIKIIKSPLDFRNTYT